MEHVCEIREKEAGSCLNFLCFSDLCSDEVAKPLAKRIFTATLWPHHHATAYD